jgi:D-alanyl-D-alanine carboxypeptidase (penicillin-binding protein 5/6)
MKKSNVLVIAAVLIAVHVLVFLAFIGSREESPREPRAAPVPKAATAPSDPTIPEFNVPELQLLPALTAVTPVDKPTSPDTQSREVIAKPGTREGYLRSDRAGRRTSTVYSKLTGDPYRSAIVIDARTGRILYEDHADAYAYPASVTKMMTLLIVLEQVDKGLVRLDEKVEITREAMGVGGSQAYLDVRESGLYSVDDLLKALMIHSANDAARVLGIHVAGSKKAFVDMMNQKARELGMSATIYHSEHGLPPTDGSQPDISTAYDIALLSQAVLLHPETLRYTGTKLDYLPPSPLRPEPFMLANRNVLVGKAPYAGCDGLKTGYHGMGGWSLAATAERNGQRVVAILLGSPDRNTRNDTARKLLDKGFAALAN